MADVVNERMETMNRRKILRSLLLTPLVLPTLPSLASRFAHEKRPDWLLEAGQNICRLCGFIQATELENGKVFLHEYHADFCKRTNHSDEIVELKG